MSADDRDALMWQDPEEQRRFRLFAGNFAMLLLHQLQCKPIQENLATERALIIVQRAILELAKSLREPSDFLRTTPPQADTSDC